MKRCRIVAGALVFAFWTIGGAIASAGIITPAGLNPGDTFHMLFVSSAERNATSPDIAVYDQFVSNLAAAAGLDTYDGSPVVWRALGSTATVSAISRLPATAAALYRMDGAQVATSGADLWDGSILNPINVTETGTVIAPGPPGTNVNLHVWTGTNPFGNPESGFVLGQPPVGPFSGSTLFGNVSQIGESWIYEDGSGNIFPNRFYAFSEQLTVPGAQPPEVPEPASATLLLMGGVVALWAGRREGRRGRSRRLGVAEPTTV